MHISRLAAAQAVRKSDNNPREGSKEGGRGGSREGKGRGGEGG